MYSTVVIVDRGGGEVGLLRRQPWTCLQDHFHLDVVSAARAQQLRHDRFRHLALLLLRPVVHPGNGTTRTRVPGVSSIAVTSLESDADPHLPPASGRRRLGRGRTVERYFQSLDRLGPLRWEAPGGGAFQCQWRQFQLDPRRLVDFCTDRGLP